MKVKELRTKNHLKNASIWLDHMIRPSDLILDYKTRGEWKVQLTRSTNFVYSNDCYETRNLRTKSDNIKIMKGDETDEIIDELFESFSQNYQNNLEESRKWA